MRRFLRLSFSTGCALVAFAAGAAVAPSSSAASSDVKLTVSGMTATMTTGAYTVTFNAKGAANSLVANGRELIGKAAGFYTDFDGGAAGLAPTKLTVVTNTIQLADIAYVGPRGEQHYVMRSGVNGIYSYFVTSAGIGAPGEFRSVYRLDGSIFRVGANSLRSGTLPTLGDIQNATVLQDSTYRLPNGTVYTKYDWATLQSEDLFHGLSGNGYGVWVIPASHEYNNGGPMKQELMVHLESNTGDATALGMLSASHFGNPAVAIPAGKIYGPWLIYFNNGDSADARARATQERAAWPYTWLANPRYPLSRTAVTGTLNLRNGQPAAGATVTLGQPGGDLYAMGRDYIYSTTAGANGQFRIPNVRPGSYSLYAYANGGSTASGAIGTVTDQYQRDNVAVSGSTTNLGTLTWSPTTYGHPLWQIGTADRTAREFRLGDQPRQYGLFDQVPANLTYTVGSSTARNDWYYAQTKPGTWTVKFTLGQSYAGNGHLTVALAATTRSPNITAAVNGTSIGDFPTYANDGAIYRSANTSGYYHRFTLNFPASALTVGANTLTLRANGISAGGGDMYDTVALAAD
ncbi:polysaccharide lyase family protein [Micromonospora sp. 067-2]|uniref:polysaccharide lyase family protein n=1 Tax=Micromonospora sp. 067-2 TaxID=2789270 RepID=UPI00397E900D